MISTAYVKYSVSALNKPVTAFQRYKELASAVYPSFFVALIWRETLPNGTVQPVCNLPVLGGLVPYG